MKLFFKILLEAVTIELVFALFWMITYLTTKDDMAGILSIIFICSHLIIMEIRKTTKEYFNANNAN